MKQYLSRSSCQFQMDRPIKATVRPHCIFCLVVALSLVGMTGCGNKDRPKTIPVSGTITFDGAAPEYAGALFFAPITAEEGYPKRPGRALFETDGKFEATSYEPGDGLVPGTYRVRVESWKKPPGMGGPGVSYVPKGFEAKDLIVSMQDKSIQYDLEVPTK